MNALQKFKAKLVPGARCAFAAVWCKDAIRTVVTVQTRKVSFTHPTKSGESWLDLPKLSEITETSPDCFIIVHTDDPQRKNPLCYNFDPKTINAVEQKLKG